MNEKKELKIKDTEGFCKDIAVDLYRITNNIYYNSSFLTEQDLSLLTLTVFKNIYLKNNKNEKQIRREIETETDTQKKIKLYEDLFQSMLFRGARDYLKKDHIDELFLDDFVLVLKQQRQAYIYFEKDYPENKFTPEINRIHEKKKKIPYYLGILRQYLLNENAVENFNKTILMNECLDLYNSYLKSKNPETKEQLISLAKKAHMGKLLKNIE